MDSSGSSISSEATQYLKEMLNLGKRASTTSETSTASLASNVRDNLEDTSLGNGDGRLPYSSVGEIIYSSDQDRQDGYSSPGEISEKKHTMQGTPSSSGNEADRSHSLAGDVSNEEHQQELVENGRVSLTELLSSMDGQPLPRQQILLQGDDTHNSFSVYGRDVDMVSSLASGAASTAGSNKVKINPVVNFDWEHKHYVGNLVAVHRNCIHMAYVLRGKTGGIVRVINRKTAQRALLRGFTSRVIDISFAHLSPIVIGAVDDIGNMFIYEIMEAKDGKIDTSLLLQVNRPANTPADSYHRLIWCPYIPDEEDSSGTTANTTADSSVVEDVGKLLVLTHGPVAEMWNVDIVAREYGSGPLQPSQVETGYLVIKSHSKAITDASFSPDGTALATASLDGEVKFFQVYMHDTPRCLHEWKPHDGRPLSSLFFLDDHKHPNPEVQFWKFVITGCDHNQELKVWSCVSWQCLQTIRILPPPDLPSNFQVLPCIKAHMDLSANHLILSDIRRKVLYVLQLYQDAEQGRAHVSSVSEFLLTQPCLSFAILDASRRKFVRALDQKGDTVDDLTTGEVAADDDEEVGRGVDGPNVGILVKMCSIHTKALQELQIRFKPETSTPQPPPASMSSFSQDETGLKDRLSDISMDTTMDSESQSDPSEPSDKIKTPVSTNINLPTGPLSDQSVISSSQSTPRDVGSDSISSEHTPSAEQARAQAEAHLKELIKGAYGGVRQLSSPLGHTGSPIGQPRPLLMTPDSFISSNRKESGQAMDSLRSSGSSSFTQVTAMEEDQLRTPHGSVSHNQPSPGSSITLTPASSKDLSMVCSPHDLPNISSVPATPSTPGEDDALSASHSESLPKASPIIPDTPPRTSINSLPPPANATSQEFYTSSPASQKTRDFRPPVKSDSEGAETSLEDIFDRRVATQRQNLQSTGSSSSTSLEVLEILEGARKPGQDIMYEEEESETPQQDQDERNQEASDDKERDSPKDRESEQEHDSPEDTEGEHSPCVTSQQDDIPADSESSPNKYDQRIWPKPPDIDVQMEARRLASEAINRAANFQPSEPETQPSEDVVVEGEVDIVIESDEEEEEVVEDDDDNEEEEDKGDDVQIEVEEIIEEIIEQEEGGGEVVLHTHDIHTQDKSSSQDRSSHDHSSHDHSSHDRTPPGATQHILPSPVDIPSIRELTESVQSMVSMFRIQQQEIEQLRTEIQLQHQTSDTVMSLQSHIANLESALTSRLTGALDQHSQSETQRLQQVLGERETRERVKHDQLVSTLSKTLNQSLSNKLEKCVKDEIKNTVLPSITKLIDPIKHQLHNDIAQKLTATDTLVKENISKLVRSRQTIEAMGNAAGNALEGPLQATCRDVLAPSFERACQSVCHQVNTTFQRGTQEYVQQLEGHMEQVRRRHEESRDPVVQQMQTVVETFKRHEESHMPMFSQLTQAIESIQGNFAALQSSHQHLEANIQQSVHGLQDLILGQVKKIIEEEVVTVLREQQASINDQLMQAMRSQAPTPVASPPDPQQLQGHVMQLLRQGQLNSAFQQALSASDLKLVMYVCEAVDPSKVFNQSPCPLQQPVLLSLIQQLSADLTTSLTLKHKYLEEAVMNLDQSNPVTREHLPAVVGQLCQKLQTYIQLNPQDKMTRQIKMLLMGAQSLLK